MFTIRNNWRMRERGLPNLIRDYKLAKPEVKLIDSLLKEPWVKAGKSRSVGLWLLGCSCGVLSMIVVGGYVRLTKSGLSMIKWDLNRVFPPSSTEEWTKEFNDYKKHPQYQNDFPSMNLDEFKRIYLLEFYHRQMGKGLGVLFLVPFLYFAGRGYLKKRIYLNLLGLLGVGSLQGFLGWWMVKSGLNESLGANYKKKDVKVAPYRLAVHFTTAVVLYGILLSTSLFLLRTHPGLKRSFSEYSIISIGRHACFGALFWNFITLITGSLMAGSYAGKICNTFPKMGDQWVPNSSHLFDPTKFLKLVDIFENQFIIHFNHRLVATLNLGVVISNFYKLLSTGVISNTLTKSYLTITLLTIFQYCLGIVNVFSGCGLETAHLHQFFGIASFTACIFAAVSSRKLNSSQLKILLSHLHSKDSAKLNFQLAQFKERSPNNFDKYFKVSVTELGDKIKI